MAPTKLIILTVPAFLHIHHSNRHTLHQITNLHGLSVNSLQGAHHKQHKPSSVHSKECNPITVLLHHRTASALEPFTGCTFCCQKQRDFPQSILRERGPKASPWVCFGRGWCCGRQGLVIIGQDAVNMIQCVPTNTQE